MKIHCRFKCCFRRIVLRLSILYPFLAASAAENKTAGTGGLRFPPAVFAVENEYQIMMIAPDTLVRIRVGDQFYSDHSNGVRPSVRPVHRFRIPMEKLDRAGKYTVFCRPLPKRLPYLNKIKPEPEDSQSFTFLKVPEKDIRIYHLADTHNRLDSPAKTALASGRIDLLILNGDIMDSADRRELLEYPCILAGKITGGTIPVICTRGNHELRGEYAEFLTDYLPNSGGRFYYTVRLGPVWALVLDGGEDKVDEYPSYGYTIDCARHRREVLEFMKEVMYRKKFEDAGIRCKLVICHVPFSLYIGKNAEDETERRRFMIYGEWCKVLRTALLPDLTLCGHVHQNRLMFGRDPYPFPVITGSMPGQGERFSGASIELKGDRAILKFTDQDGKTESETVIYLKTGLPGNKTT